MGHASAHNTEMWMPWRLWAMLVQLLVEPWSAGYHQPYHNSPKLRKIPQPEGKRLHFWTIQRRLWNCANRQSRGSVLNHTCSRSNTPLYKSLVQEKQSSGGRERQRLSRLESPRQSHRGSMGPLYTRCTFIASRFTTLTPCFQLHDKKQRPFENMIKMVGLGEHKRRERQMGWQERWGRKGV